MLEAELTSSCCSFFAIKWSDRTLVSRSTILRWVWYLTGPVVGCALPEHNNGVQWLAGKKSEHLDSTCSRYSGFGAEVGDIVGETESCVSGADNAMLWRLWLGLCSTFAVWGIVLEDAEDMEKGSREERLLRSSLRTMVIRRLALILEVRCIMCCCGPFAWTCTPLITHPLTLPCWNWCKQYVWV